MYDVLHQNNSLEIGFNKTTTVLVLQINQNLRQIAIDLVYILAYGLLIMWAWNIFIPDTFNLDRISYLDALGLRVLGGLVTQQLTYY